MSRLKTISDKLDYIAMGKLNAEQMEYICEINQEVNLKDREIERLKENNQAMQEEMARTWKKLDEKENIIKEVREYIESYMPNYDFDKTNLIKLLEILDKGEINSVEI